MVRHVALVAAAGLVIATGVAVVSPATHASAPPRGPATAVRRTLINGHAWTADNAPIPAARLRLRNVATGKVDASTMADDAGRFTFAGVEGGSYVVELVDEGGRVLTVGHVFTIEPGETVATFVRLGTKVRWFSGLFGNAAAAVASAAASEGITALSPIARPASAGR